MTLEQVEGRAVQDSPTARSSVHHECAPVWLQAHRQVTTEPLANTPARQSGLIRGEGEWVGHVRPAVRNVKAVPAGAHHGAPADDR
jgi:hypothetical protein